MSTPPRPPTQPRPDLSLELVSNPIYLCAVREMINLSTKRLGFADNAASQVALAVDEAIVNVMKHGYEKKLDGRIWLRLTPVGEPVEAVEIVIEDEARQVEPGEIKGRDLEDIRPGGLGVHIIREVMDEVKYEKRPGAAGMRLTMTKRRASEKATMNSRPNPCTNCDC